MFFYWVKCVKLDVYVMIEGCRRFEGFIRCLIFCIMLEWIVLGFVCEMNFVKYMEVDCGNGNCCEVFVKFLW